jgi:hypothetical protein
LTIFQINAIVVSPTPSLQPSHGTTSSSSSSLERFKPEDIADALAVIEGELYSKITEFDYIAHVRGTPATTRITSASKINGHLVNWVKLDIIGSGNDCLAKHVSLIELSLICLY